MTQLIIGPMFSGKTTEMLRRLTRYSLAGRRVVLVRPSCDTREQLTHDNLQHNFFCYTTDKISKIFDEIIRADVIGVDEGQFFEGLAKDVDRLSGYGRTVIVSGLNATSERKPFKEIQNLIPLSEQITKLNAVCSKCGSDFGSFSYYKSGVKNEDVMIGAQDLYTSLCRNCYDKTIKG